jgi:hypothetical protein
MPMMMMKWKTTKIKEMDFSSEMEKKEEVIHISSHKKE